jgi:adenosine deaminase
MLEAGLAVTLGSDDPAYFGGYLDDVVTALRTSLGTTDDDLATMAATSFRAAFAPEGDRARWLAEVDAWRASRP